MFLAYIDESYSSSHYFIAALLVPEDKALNLAGALDEVVANASRNFGTTGTAELHGHRLFQGQEDWEPLRFMPRARIGIYHQAFTSIAANEVKIILRGIEIHAGNRSKSPQVRPHSTVLKHILQQVNDFAVRTKQWALVIADEIDNQDSHRKNLRVLQTRKDRAERSSSLSRIVDTIHFAPSHSSRLIQASDLVVYLHRRIQIHGLGHDLRAQRANAALWKQIESQVIHQN